ncbi:MAG: hypothetical protein R3F19_00750 [Verrucomicrobiales bacterium]
MIAETESSDTPETANVLGLNATESGSMRNPDEDYFIITNSPRADFIKIDLEFAGQSSEEHRMNVYGPNSSSDVLANLVTGTGPIAACTVGTRLSRSRP